MSILAGLLLVVYPISDAAATVVDLRTDTTGRSRLAQRVNAATSIAAAVTVAIGVTVSLVTAMDVFAVGRSSAARSNSPSGCDASASWPDSGP